MSCEYLFSSVFRWEFGVDVDRDKNKTTTKHQAIIESQPTVTDLGSCQFGYSPIISHCVQSQM